MVALASLADIGIEQLAPGAAVVAGPLGEHLAGVDLALGQGHVAVLRAVDQQNPELVVDEAMDYLVTQYTVPIYNAAELERAFWAAAAIRAKRMHDGRAETVRAGWTRGLG